jgi:flagellar biosynthesis component FlhA
VFCPSPGDTLRDIDLPTDAWTEAANPVDGRPGCWVDPAYADELIEHGVEVWRGAGEYMIRHLEQVLRRNASDFVGAQEVEALLERWTDDPHHVTEAGLIADALPDDAHTLRFGRLLRALLDEQVAITDWPALIESVYESGLPTDDIHADLRAARLRLKPHLPGNRPGDTRVEVPEAIEQAVGASIQTDGDARFLAMPPEEVQEQLSTLREVLHAHDPNAVLVTRDGQVRPFLRRLIAMEFPSVMVIADDELLPMPVPPTDAYGGADPFASDFLISPSSSSQREVTQ